MPRRTRYRRAVAKLEKCPECGGMSAFIYRCEDGKDRCVVCIGKWYVSKYKGTSGG